MSVRNMCKICKNFVITAHKCGKCSAMSHKSCFKTIKEKFCEDSSVDCCHSQPSPTKSSNVITDISTNITINVDKTAEQIRMTYLEEIIRQKDSIISNQAMLV